MAIYRDNPFDGQQDIEPDQNILPLRKKLTPEEQREGDIIARDCELCERLDEARSQIRRWVEDLPIDLMVAHTRTSSINISRQIRGLIQELEDATEDLTTFREEYRRGASPR
jgi:hypothetical protein